MKEYEVNFETFKQYTIRTDVPILVYEDEYLIKLTTFVGQATIVFYYEKLGDEDTLMFKENFLSGKPQIIYVVKEHKQNINFKIGIQDDDSTQTGSRPEQL